MYLILWEVPGHPHGMTFGNVTFHLPIGLPLCKAVLVISCRIWQSMGGFYISVQDTIISIRRTDDLIFSGRSFIKMRNRTGPKTDPLGTPDRTGTRSEA